MLELLELVIPVLAFILILIGIWHEEKLIAFEDKLAVILFENRVAEFLKDRLAYLVAQVIVKYRRCKAKK